MPDLDDIAAKAEDFRRNHYEQNRSRRWNIARGDEGDGTTLRFGQYKGARYIGVQLRGFSGWSSSRWMPGGWEFFNPTIYVGRLFTENAYRSWSCEVRIPAKVWDFYYWRIKPSGRRYMREHGHEQPMEAQSV